MANKFNPKSGYIQLKTTLATHLRRPTLVDRKKQNLSELSRIYILAKLATSFVETDSDLKKAIHDLIEADDGRLQTLVTEDAISADYPLDETLGVLNTLRAEVDAKDYSPTEEDDHICNGGCNLKLTEFGTNDWRCNVESCSHYFADEDPTPPKKFFYKLTPWEEGRGPAPTCKECPKKSIAVSSGNGDLLWRCEDFVCPLYFDKLNK
jgi:hypothetical protein